MRCLQEDDTCAGPVGNHLALSGSGERYPRCEHHYEQYVARVQPRIDQIRQHYPDSPIPPVWHDPSFAGERWEDD